MTSADPKRQLLRALCRELRWRPLARRRLLCELTSAAHAKRGPAHSPRKLSRPAVAPTRHR